MTSPLACTVCHGTDHVTLWHRDPVVAAVVAPAATKGTVAHFTILGIPRSKGNSPVVIQVGKKRIPLPSKPYRKWFKLAMQQAPIVMGSVRRSLLWCAPGPLTVPVNMTAHWYFDTLRFPDEDNLKKGLGDYLQRMGLVENDRLIHWTGDCSRAKDVARPRTEVTITLSAPSEAK